MKKILPIVVAAFAITLVAAPAQVPSILNYQGRVTVGGTNFNGIGQFKFALVRNDNTFVWRNDGAATSGEPATAVGALVQQGLYATLLGDTTLSNMAAIPAEVFTNSNIGLRVWFSAGGTNPFVLLTPDQRIGASGYALRAASAESAAIANVTGNLAVGGTLTAGKVIGGSNNTSSLNGTGAVIAGGEYNTANFPYATVGGGYANLARDNATIAGGQYNTARGDSAAIGGGFLNYANGDYSFVGGGQGNNVNGDYSFVGGGQANTATANYAAIGGGSNNMAGGDYATIGGGTGNQSTNPFSTVSGGSNNVAGEWYTTVGGGRANTASGSQSTIGGGWSNRASAFYSGVGSGVQNAASGASSTVAGGANNTASGQNATVGGGFSNNASANHAAIAGGWQNTASGLYSAIGGGIGNESTNPFATVSGGSNNLAGDWYATIGGGRDNTASGSQSTIGGGWSNRASEFYTTVSGGRENTASGYAATIGGGLLNLASGQYSTVPGGRENSATHDYSFAVGRRAKTTAPGQFVWADSQDADYSPQSDKTNSFNVRAKGGVRFESGEEEYNVGFRPNGVAVTWIPGMNNWEFTSDASMKENLREVDPREVLKRVASLHITEWSYRGYAQRNIGPMAQDWHAAFPSISTSDRQINSGHLQGIALVAIQGLVEELKDRDKTIEELKAKSAEVDALKSKLEAVEQRLNSLPPAP